MQSSGGQLTHTILNELSESNGRITDVGLYPAQAASYIVFKVGSYYYVLNGSTGKIETGATSTLAATAIQWALDNLTSARTWKENIVLKGSFTLTTDIVLPSYIILQILGKLMIDANTNKNIISGDTKTDIDIIGGILDGNKNNNVGQGDANIQNGVWFKDCQRCTVRNVYSKNNEQSGIRFYGSTDSRIINCYTSDNVLNGIYLGSGASRNQLHSIFSWNNGKYGIYLWYNCSDNIISQSHIRDQTESGIMIYGYASGQTCKKNKILGNSVYLNGYHGIIIQGAPDTEIGDCHVFNNGIGATNTYDGIYAGASVYRSDRLNVHDCHIFGDQVTPTQRYGVNLYYPEDCKVHDNVFYGNVSGAYFGTSALRVKIKSNVGYVTENSGNSTGTGAEQTIPHGLVGTPNNVVIIPTASGATVSGLYANATNIYVTVTSGKTYNWYASL